MLFVAGKAGVIDHHVAEGVQARLVVPLTPVPVTAKAYAVLGRAATTFVPDAVALAAPLLAVADPGGGDPLERVRGVAAAMSPHGVDAWRAMVERAESFLAGWQEHPALRPPARLSARAAAGRYPASACGAGRRRSPTGAATRARVADHEDAIREGASPHLERR